MKCTWFLLMLTFIPVSVAADGLPELKPPKTGRTAAQDAAVVIGVERYYALAHVQYAERDADLFHRFLLDTVGVPAARISNLYKSKPAREDIEREVKKRAGQVGTGGTLWIYFAGHGASLPGENDVRLLGVDVQGYLSSIRERSVSRSWLTEQGTGSRAARVMLVLDACFSGKTRSGNPITGDRFAAPAAYSAVKKVAVWSAASADEVSGPCKAVQHGLFTYFLVGALSGWAGEDADLSQVSRYLGGAVASALSAGKRSQTPELTADADLLSWRAARLKSALPGPNLKDLSRRAYCTSGGSGGGFQVSAPTAKVPQVVMPGSMDGALAGLSFDGVDVDALSAYDAAVKYDRAGASPLDKAKRWEGLGRKHSRFLDTATERAAKWRAYDWQRKEEARLKAERDAARDKDWGKLSRLLVLEVVPEKKKRLWSKEFVDAYGTRGNPYLSAMAGFLPAGTLPVDVTSGIRWVRLEGGTFRMGSTGGDSDEKPVHTVRVAAFEMAQTEVTVAQYRRCVKAGECTAPDNDGNCNWGKSGRDDHPVNCVDWKQANVFCAWVGARLPTEAEWEYAARSGGKDIKYPWGDEAADCGRAVMDPPGDVGNGCGKDSTWPVCSKPRGNSTQGLCDMAGNVWEWVADCWHGSYQGAPSNGTAWTSGCAGSYRVHRGGSWDYNARRVRAANRYRHSPGFRYYYLGFRPARSIP